MWLAAIVTAAGIAWAVYRLTGIPHQQKYCVVCKQVRLWHPKKGCTSCRTLDSSF
jgi:hypothetical protein